jgi:hypothetical protein
MKKKNGGAGHNTQFADYRAAGRFSAPRGETLLLFPARHSKTFIASQRARGWDRGESAVGARHIVREHDTTQPVLNKDKKRAQGQTAPGVPRKRVLGGQGSSACRGTPSRGEARALHHQPVPALTLTMTCISCSRSTFDRWIHQVPLEKNNKRSSSS